MIENTLKAIASDGNDLIVANYIVLFGGRDLSWLSSGPNPDGSKGDYFSSKTVLDSPYTETGIVHLDWEHGFGKAIDGDAAPGRDDILGYVDWKTARKDARGWWVERVLSRRNKYVKWLEDLIRAGMIGTSSEAIEGKVVRARDGELQEWPLRRDTLTVTPAEPRMMSENVVTALKNLADKFPVPPASPTLAEKARALSDGLTKLLSDTRQLVGGADRLLTQTKRQELTELLEMFSGLDAVRSDVESVLAAATPASRVQSRRTLYELAEQRKRLARVFS